MGKPQSAYDQETKAKNRKSAKILRASVFTDQPVEVELEPIGLLCFYPAECMILPGKSLREPGKQVAICLATDSPDKLS